MGKKKTADAAPETAGTETAAKPMKKVDAVRAALADGVESPTEGVDYIKKKFGIEMNTQTFSTSKFQIAKAKGEKKPGRKPGATPKVATMAKAAPSANGASPADLARTVKQLVAAHGVMAVAEMVQVFSE